jgi:transcriptional regulator with XRE-family HTH domain
MAKNPKLCPNDCGNPLLEPYALCGQCLREVLSQNLGDRLKKSLKYAHMSVEDMAEFFGTHRNTISGYLRNGPKPSRFQMKHWAEKTGVPLEWLQTGTWPDQTDVNDTDPAVETADAVTPAERLSILAEQLSEIAHDLGAESPAHAVADDSPSRSQDAGVHPQPDNLTQTQLQTWNYLVAHDSDEGVDFNSVASGLRIKGPAAYERCKKLVAAGYAKALGKGHYRVIG